MVFGMSMGEVVVIVVAAAWVFGPNELPRVARTAGRLTGQATGFLYRTRAKFFKFAEETEVTKLHAEMQATMYQLHAIRSELQGGINLFQPGPLTQRMLSIKPMPGQSQLDSFQHQEQQQTVAAAAAAWAPPSQTPLQNPQQQQQQQQQQAPEHARQPLPATSAPMGSWAASVLQGGPTAGVAAAAAAAAAAGEAAASEAAPPTPQSGAGRQLAAPTAYREEGGEQVHPMTMPVSAVAAGWAPDRTGCAPTGSEVLLDALAEELVAGQLLRFQQQQQQLAMQQQQQAAAQQQQAAQQQLMQQSGPDEEKR